MSNLTLVLDRKELVVRMESRSIRIDRPYNRVKEYL